MRDHAQQRQHQFAIKLGTCDGESVNLGAWWNYNPKPLRRVWTAKAKMSRICAVAFLLAAFVGGTTALESCVPALGSYMTMIMNTTILQQ
jgi:hypothetical protein